MWSSSNLCKVKVTLVNLDPRPLSQICPFQPGTGKLGLWALQTLYHVPSPSPSKHGLFFYLSHSFLTLYLPPPASTLLAPRTLPWETLAFLCWLWVSQGHIIWLIPIPSTYPYSSRPHTVVPWSLSNISQSDRWICSPKPDNQATGLNSGTPSSVL